MLQWSEQLRLLRQDRESRERDTTLQQQQLLHPNVFFANLCDHLNQHVERLTVRQSEETYQSTINEWILETECACRCANLVLLNHVDATSTVAELQHVAVMTNQLHLPLIRILSLPSNSSLSDRAILAAHGKIYQHAARLLCNLITGNSTTALLVLTSIPLSPSNDEINASIRNRIIVPTNQWSHGQKQPTSDSSFSPIHSLNWVDVVMGCSRFEKRSALAAVIAGFHNAVVVLNDDTASSLANDSILVSTILRQMLPPKSMMSNSMEASAADEATEWITLFLERLTAMGLLPQLYAAIGKSSMVTPEHLVLLHCISARVEEWFESSHKGAQPHPLGNTDDGLVETHLFLARLVSQSRISIHAPVMDSMETSRTSSEDLDMDTTLLKQSSYFLIMDILAISLGYDGNHDCMTLVRTKLGTETLLIRDVSLELGRIVDRLLQSSQGVKARELKLEEKDQRWITTLVRVLANACFSCPSTQDWLRCNTVPIANDTAPHGKDALVHQESQRTALHVLLSCTSLAHGCFTLREWAIVALRNALEGNLENQAVVEALEAQQPLQSPVLEKMGIKVDLDRHGNVKVVPSLVTRNSNVES